MEVIHVIHCGELGNRLDEFITKWLFEMNREPTKSC